MFARPDPKPRSDDKDLAEAFRNLEGGIADLRNALLVAEMMFEDVLDYGQGRGPSLFLGGRKAPDGYMSFFLTEDQYDALHYAVFHSGDLGRALHENYHAAYEHAPR